MWRRRTRGVWPSIWGWRGSSRWSICWAGPGGTRTCCGVLVLAATPDAAWERRSAGAGSKGQRFYDWAAHTVTVKDQLPAEGYEHTLLIRRTRTPKVTTKHPEGIYE